MSKENGAIGPQFRGNKLSDKDVFTSEAEVEIEMQEDLPKDMDSSNPKTDDIYNQDMKGQVLSDLGHSKILGSQFPNWSKV